MGLIADILLLAGASGAAIYCLVLSRRLQRFTRLESGMGGAVAVLSAQVDEMTRALEQARKAASASVETLDARTARAEQMARRLELLMASMHDLPEVAEPSAGGATRQHAPAGSTESCDRAGMNPEFRASPRTRVTRRRQTREPVE